MSKSKRREAIRARRQREKRRRALIWGGLAALVVAALGLILWNAVRPAAGQQIAVLPPNHVPEGTDPGPYTSEPPSSGPHYGAPFAAGFYETGDPEAEVPFPEGYLMHNLEHGYVVLWYNCAGLQESDCRVLKSEIKEVMERNDNFKLIAFPRPAMDSTVALTSWGRLLSMQQFDGQRASRFIAANLNRAPEPGAP